MKSQIEHKSLQQVRERDRISADNWFKEPALGGCGQAFIDRRWLLSEVERLQRAVRPPRAALYLFAGSVSITPLMILLGKLSLSHLLAPLWSVFVASCAISYLSGWVWRELFRARIQDWSNIPEEFICADCRRPVWRLGLRRPHRPGKVCLECEQFPGWFLDRKLADVFDPAHQARPRTDFVNGVGQHNAADQGGSLK